MNSLEQQTNFNSISFLLSHVVKDLDAVKQCVVKKEDFEGKKN
jgi:hypothetical protein